MKQSCHRARETSSLLWLSHCSHCRKYWETPNSLDDRNDDSQSWHFGNLDLFLVQSRKKNQVFLITHFVGQGPVTPICVPTACSWRCKIHWIAVGSQEKFRKNVQFYLKVLQVEMSRRPEGDRGILTELTRRVTAFPQSYTWRLTALLLSIQRALITF